MKTKIVVTGSTGFVGRALAECLISHSEYELLLPVRKNVSFFSDNIQVLLPDQNIYARPLPLANVQTVVHLAGRAHILADHAQDPLGEFRKINVKATVDLARQSILAGVKRFIFVSSIGVNGTQTTDGAFNESSIPNPLADYAISKLEAEKALWELVKESSMELVVIRPPLVYAGHAPGNFNRLLKLVSLGLPLPFASLKNSRSMIALENLVSFIGLCIKHPSAANQLFLVADAYPVSTAEIVTFLAEGMGRKSHLFPLADLLFRFGAIVLRKTAIYHQLCGSLIVDDRKARDLLGWVPPLEITDALRLAGRNYAENKG